MTAGMDSAEADHDLLVARARVGLRVVAVAVAAFTLADLKLVHHGLAEALLVRCAQFLLIGIAYASLRRELRWRARVVAMALFVAALYVTSAIAGSLRGSAATQPITGLAIAFATATTLPWGPWPQLATVAVAVTAIAVNFLVAHGSLTGSSPHMAAGLGVAFLVSVYIAQQLQRYRRERDRAEAALRRNEDGFRALIERGRDVITIFDAAGIIRYESPSIERVLGYRAEEPIGRSAYDYVHPDDVPAVAAAFANAIAAETAAVECRVARPDGTWCPVEAVFTNLLDHPAVGGVVANWRDVSDRKAAEAERARHILELARARDEALASTRAKSMFLANVSHEIRTPLNVIIGMTDMVLDGPLGAEQRANLDRVRNAAIGQLAIISDILDASKIEAGKMTIQVVDMDLRATVEEATGMLVAAAAAKGLTLDATIAPDVPRVLRGDPVRLRQTLVNLIGNAVKFTDRGAVAVHVRVARRLPSHVTMRIEVHDTGIGIPRDRQARIFESFAQGDDSTTRVYGGTGLGLAICRQLVTLMGGHMGLESEPGRGSTFWFELALECVAATDPAAA